MRQEQKQLKMNIHSIDDNQNVIQQQTLTLTKHKNDQKYLIISKNDFGKNFRINAGIFNKKTRFLVTENHSLLVYDQDDLNIKEMSVKEIQKKNPYMIYFIPIFLIDQNYSIQIDDTEKTTKEIKLTFELGRAFGKRIKSKSKNYEKIDDTIEPNINEDQKYFLDKIIPDTEDDLKINFDKRLLISSNYKFLLGILYELYEEQLNVENINIYLLATILNMLGASYSIRKIKEDNKFFIRFKLPLFFKKYLKNLKYLKNPEKNKDNIYNKKLKMIRNKKYLILDDEDNTNNTRIELLNYDLFKDYYYQAKSNLADLSEVSNESEISEVSEVSEISNLNKNIKDFINLGICELMPANDFKFLPVNYGDVYDFVTEGVQGATNYVLPGLPLLKNSDGDILALIGIWTEDAARNAEEKFGINKKTVTSELDGKPYSWIDIDSVLGLYNFTK